MARQEQQLTALAEAHGVSTHYTDWRGRHVDVDPDTIRTVLAAMEVDASSETAVRSALAAQRSGVDRRPLPAAVVLRQGELADGLALAGGAAWDASARTPTGEVVELGHDAGGRLQVEGLSLGWHELTLRPSAGDGELVTADVAVVPDRCPTPPGRGWGWMLQLYSIRSSGSWGIGDLGDLEALLAWSGRDLGADFAIINPLHAPTPVAPVEPSPYYPSSRRFYDPLALRVETLAERELLDGDGRRALEALASPLRAGNRSPRIDRDAVLRAKLEALRLLHEVSPPRRREAFSRWRTAQGEALERFATFCALAERHGGRWSRWPAELRHPTSSAVAEAATALADRVELHAWAQWLLDAQLAQAQRTAIAAGMAIGVIHDLAVGVAPDGADAWALADDLADAVRVGAPPDPFNQRGQNWGQPPLRPDRLTSTAYRPWREITAAVLRHGGGIRVDHILGLFRLWWIPEGAEPTAGTYVRYPANDLLGVLALQAHAAGAIVIGEDLGVVAPGVREALAERGMLGSRVAYFERGDDGRPRRPSAYTPLALASVTTHDLPTAAGWWTDEEVRIQDELGQLAEDTDVRGELERKARERAEVVELLRDEGLLDGDPDDIEVVIRGLHRLLARSASCLVAATPNDAVGDREQPNLPGTTDAYPNWRLPLAAPSADGRRPLLLEELRDHPGARRLAAILSDRAQSSGSASH